jgi:hypothetical protein
LNFGILVVDDAKAILEVFCWFQILRHLEHFLGDDDILHTVKCIATDIVRARTICDHIPTFLESLHEIRMDVKLIILLGIITIVRDEYDVVVAHRLDDGFQIVSARRHVLQENPLLEFATVAHHGVE